ncbi:MAG: AsmA family protein [Pseudomonadota bacterium]
MRRLLKWIGGIIGVVIGLALIAMLVVTLFVDPNDYKGLITEQVKTHTGRELKIEGDIDFSFFPWLGLELGRLELGNAEGFGPEPFAGIEAADVKVKILPLLRGEVKMDTIVLHGLNLSLTRRADGVSNWDDLAAKGEPGAEEKPEEKPAEPAASPEQALKALAIGGIEIRDANVQWNDEMAGQRASVTDFNLTSGAIILDDPFPFSLDGKVSASKPAINATIDLATNIGLDLSNQRYRLDGTKLGLDAESELIPGGKASVTLKGDLAADLTQQTASAKGLTLEGMGMKLDADVSAGNIMADPTASGSLKLVLTDPDGLSSVVTLPPELNKAALKGGTVDTEFQLDLGEARTLSLAPLNLAAMGLELKVSMEGKQIIDQPAFSGELSSNEFVPRELLSNVGVALPEMADPSTLTKARLSSRFDAGLDNVALSDLQVVFDQTTLAGSASVKQFKAPVIRYQLELDEIDVDRYLPPPSEESAEQGAEAETDAGEDKTDAGLPLEMLRSLDIDGTFKVGKVKVMNLNSDSIVTTLRAEKGQFRVHPLTANLYQGGYSGDLRFDVRSDTPKLGMDEKLSGVESGPLLKDFMGKDYVTGKANVAAKLTASGVEPMAVRKSLNGNGSFSFENGQVKGINIGHLIRQGYALYKGRQAPKEEVKETDFTALRGSFTVTNGLVSTRDLTARSPLFEVDGSGTAHLVSEKLDMRLETTIVSSFKDAANQSVDELEGVMIPITIKGSFGEPKYGVDVESVLKAKLEAEVEKKKEEIKTEAKERVEKEKEEAKAKAEEKVEEEKDKLEDKAKEKLKDMLKF